MPRAHSTGNDFVPLLLLVVSFESLAFHGVRYQVHDVSRSVAFYIQHLGFKLEHQQLPAFASVSLDDVQVLLSGPGASGSRPMPDGRPQVPGGWNRVVLRVADLPSCIESLKHAGLTSGTRWKSVQAGSRSSWRIQTGIRLSCLNQRDKQVAHPGRVSYSITVLGSGRLAKRRMNASK